MHATVYNCWSQDEFPWNIYIEYILTCLFRVMYYNVKKSTKHPNQATYQRFTVHMHPFKSGHSLSETEWSMLPPWVSPSTTFNSSNTFCMFPGILWRDNPFILSIWTYHVIINQEHMHFHTCSFYTFLKLTFSMRFVISQGIRIQACRCYYLHHKTTWFIIARFY